MVLKNHYTTLAHAPTQRALILGTGGASKGVAFALEELGIGYTCF
jgi:shikimate dehydrogenase